jgi:hypothetical protein
MRGLLADLEAPGDLIERAGAFVAQVEAGADYRRTLELAGLVGRIARSGAGGRDLAIDILGAIVKHQQGLPGSQW